MIPINVEQAIRLIAFLCLLYNIAELNKQHLLNAYCFSVFFLDLLIQNFTHFGYFQCIFNTLKYTVLVFSLLVSKAKQNIN